MRSEKLTLDEARRLTLSSQLLLNSHRAESKNDLLKIIEKLGYVQIDTISIVERAHKHILWTRFPSYKNEILEKLIDKDKKVFEYWDHAAAYLPMKDYRFSLPRKRMYAEKYKVWEQKNKKLLKYIAERITEEGPLQSRDFDEPKKRGLWWDWKPAKEGLEYLFQSGVLSARARKNFQKVYDLTEKVIPDTADKSFPAEEEQSRHLIKRTIDSQGFASEKEITYLRHHSSKSTGRVLNELMEESLIVPLEIEGLESECYYTFPDNLKDHVKIKRPDSLHILSPFDNLVIQRKRLKSLFGFDYVIECYVPAHKRKFGYFCLPVLYGAKFIGRLDAKADRKTGILHVIKFFPEPATQITAKIKEKLKAKLQELAVFSGCSTVSFDTY